MQRQLIFCIGWLCVTTILAEETRIATEKLPPALAQPVDFVKEVQPLLAKACYACHGRDAQESGLRLDVKKLAMIGADSGPVIVPGRSADSRLIHAIAGLDETLGRMPPEGEGEPLTSEQIALLRAWIDGGAVWPDEVAGKEETIASKHWSFQPIAHPAPPSVQNTGWVRNPIDAFVLEKLEHEKVQPAPEANRATLLRRVYLDLIGLPPTPQESAEFLADSRADAYERVVDRLLESPHFGERWGRYWLDAARYADSDGYEKDYGRPFAWRYRDWVIDAVNRDLPWDLFTVQQLAGDLLSNQDPEHDSAAKIATGFHRNTLTNREGGVDGEEDRVKRTIDRTNTTGAVWLGLTVGCANCHTHKYDPLSQREYFGLYAFFNDIDEDDASISPDQLKEQYQAVKATSTPRETYVHVRGDFLTKGPVVQPHTPEVLPPLVPRGARPDRLDLARWLVAPANPLTARVMVNRMWQGHFGRGLTFTGDDFGTQGEPPSHPALLDWLATKLQSESWQLKPLHRLIVTSATYRQSAVARPELVDRDPYNTWLARQNRLRVEAEIVRDLTLSAAGLLELGVGGPSIRPPQPAGISDFTYAGSAKWVESKGPDRYRRGMYIWFQRTSPYPMLMTFDASEANLTCTRRERSNTPLQALALLNDTVFVECAQSLALRIAEAWPAQDVPKSEMRSARVREAFRLCLSREPSPTELSALVDLYNQSVPFARKDSAAAAQTVGSRVPPNTDLPETAGCVAVARAVLNLDEFLTRE
jgi:hypothetical protein